MAGRTVWQKATLNQEFYIYHTKSPILQEAEDLSTCLDGYSFLSC